MTNAVLKKIAKLWREVKKPLARLYYYVPARQAGISPKAYTNFENHRKIVSAHKNEKVQLPYLEIDIVIGCNLKCEQCSHLSPFRRGIVPADDVLQWFRLWSEKILPKKLDILGGEPLLHPELPRILRESKEIWPQTEIELVTNGFMFSKVSQDVFHALEETQISVIISDHSNSESEKEKFAEAISKLRGYSIRHKIRKSNRKWIVQYDKTPDGVPRMFSSNPRKAWDMCLSKTCISLANNKLYKCAVLASIIEGVSENSLKKENWTNALSYQPLTLDASREEIVEHLMQREIRACTICPDKKIWLEPSQIVNLK